ncbi:MAG: LysM peptidoglycan-binding domain-containing protein [Deltaproteobacteria bacterium]|nr:LysM peptidoglycan-binding domain-containing protein [Deltaproteobacteria bacterium]MBI3293606.1 LysM peptidoglycan-binding domain-containing protein [Deltaproteobacteria bacterium]
MFRNVFMPFLTSALTLSLLVFVSCAHKGATDEASLDSEGNGSEISVDAPTDGEGENSAEAQEDDKPADDLTAAVADTPPEEQTAEASPSSEVSASPEASPTGSPDTATIEDKDSIKNEDQAAAKPNGSGDEMLSEIENPATKGEAKNPAPDIDMGKVAATDAPPSGSTPADGASVTHEGISPIGSAGGSAGFVSRVPRIPKMAIHKGDASLNRFYFLRKADTLQSLATLLMGGAGQASILKKWNPGVWKPGRLIYYASPADPADKSMQSFYQERNVPGEAYTIGKGDWLSKIAGKHYGSPMSWKEIAVLNGIKSPDTIAEGTKINLYPADLSPFSGPGQFAQKKALPPDQSANQQPPQQVATNAPPQAAQEAQPPKTEALEPPPQVPPPDVPPPSPKGKGHSVEIADLISQNILFIAVGAAILLLAIALIALRKRKSSAGSDEFGDEMSPPNARRK